MSVIRPLGISDLPRLLVQSGKLAGNQAIPKEFLISRKVNSLRFRQLIRQWFAPGNSFHSWVCIEGNDLLGLVSARERSGKVWEIDRLLFNEEDLNSSLAMLEAVSHGAAEQGVQKMFLRIPQNSTLLDVTTKAGFSSYQEENLYRTRGNTLGCLAAPEGYRFLPSKDIDAQKIFHLYCQVVPAAVRAVEGMTLKEWQACQQYTPGICHQLTCWSGEDLVGLIRITIFGRAGIVDLMVKPNHAEPILDFSLSCLCHKTYVNYLVPAFQNDIAILLQERNFELMGTYRSLIQEAAARVRQPQLAPVKV